MVKQAYARQTVCTLETRGIEPRAHFLRVCFRVSDEVDRVRERRVVFGTGEVRKNEDGCDEGEKCKHYFRCEGCGSGFESRTTGVNTPYSRDEGFNAGCQDLWRTGRT